MLVLGSTFCFWSKFILFYMFLLFLCHSRCAAVEPHNIRNMSTSPDVQLRLLGGIFGSPNNILMKHPKCFFGLFRPSNLRCFTYSHEQLEFKQLRVLQYHGLGFLRLATKSKRTTHTKRTNCCMQRFEQLPTSINIYIYTYLCNYTIRNPSLRTTCKEIKMSLVDP